MVDEDGRVGIDWGVYGVPETFVVDKSGVIRYKQIGPVTVEALEQKILPLVRSCRSARHEAIRVRLAARRSRRAHSRKPRTPRSTRA